MDHKKYTFFILSLMVYCCISVAAAGKKLNVLCSTFPVFQITRNVVGDADGVNVTLMLPAQLGCPHDYALTPGDMQKLARADILVINGLGMEEFLGAPIKKANSDIKVIDSSAGINDTIKYDDDDGHGDEPHHGHHRNSVNPHLFASPKMAALMALNIAGGLAEYDELRKTNYLKNAAVYADKMNELSHEFFSLGKKLKNKRIVQPHGIFDYLARDIGLEIVATLQPEGQEPSAAEMMKIVKLIREKKAGAIITEPQYPQKTGLTLSRETGIPIALIDPVATGPENPPSDIYETVMRNNMKVIQNTLGINEQRFIHK